MILVFGGTTEGRIAVKTLDEGEGRYYYSTRSSLQKVECAHGEHICGDMTGGMMTDFCRAKSGTFSYISKFHIIISCKLIVYIVMCFYQETN